MKTNGQLETHSYYCNGGLNKLEEDERAIKQKKGKSDMMATLAREKKTVKSFYLCCVFIPFSNLAKHIPSRWESGSLGLWLLLLVSKVTEFLSLGTVGTAFEGEMRTKWKFYNLLESLRWIGGCNIVFVFRVSLIPLHQTSHLIIYSVTGTKPLRDLLHLHNASNYNKTRRCIHADLLLWTAANFLLKEKNNG